MRRAGTTLLELLVVLTILSLLLGIGLGVFAKFSVVQAADNAAAGVRTLIRTVRNTARAHGTVGTVLAAPGSDRVVALRERVVGQWHFEEENIGAFGRDPRLVGGAELTPEGYIGWALALPAAGAGAVLGRSPEFVSPWGVALSLDLFLTGGAGPLLALGESYGLAVAGDGTLQGWVGVAPGGEGGGRPLRVTVDSPPTETVPVGRWVRVALYYDRVEVRLFLDGRPVARTAATEPLALDPQATLRVGGEQVVGRIDGVRLAVLVPGEGGELPAGVRIKEATPVIRFDPEGFLDPREHTEPARIVLEDETGRTRTLIVGWLGDVEVQ